MARLLKILLPIGVAAVLMGVFVLLHHELRRYDYAAVSASLRAIPLHKIAWGLGFTLASYLLLVCYDAFALRQVGRSPGLLRTAFASFTAYVLSYNIGLAVISGTAVRFRLYSAWGYSAAEIGRIVAFTGATFWLGLFTAAGALLAFGQPVSLPNAPLGGDLRPAGFVLLAAGLGYVVTCAVRRRPVTVRGWTLPLPRWPEAIAQIGLGASDVIMAGLVGWVVMPNGWPLEQYLPVYLVGMTAGLLSHVPGGLGVLEAVLLYGRPAGVSGPAVLGAILAFRVIYYLLPLGAAVALLAGHELQRHRHRLESAGAFAGRWAPRVAPPLFAALVFLGGVILLVTGATPPEHGRLALLRRLLPLPILELSHLASSVVGLLLLFVARGLQRRLDGAYLLTLALLGAGAIFALLRGAGWEEAFVLTTMLALLLPCRDFFPRRASLLDARFTPGWVTAIVVTIAATIWLGFFAYRHVEYRNDLWWQFAFHRNAPRFLRASVAILVVASAIGLRRLLRPADPRPVPPDAATLARAAAAVAASPEARARRVLAGESPLLFSESDRSLIRYGVEGKSWIALGDPIGEPREFGELAWSFRELADQNGGWPVFHAVGPDHLPLYLDLRLSLTGLGDEARVRLAGFDASRLADESLREPVRQVGAGGGEFEWVPASGVAAVLADLPAVFRPGRPDAPASGDRRESLVPASTVLRQNAAGVVRQAGRLVAFASVLSAANRAERSIAWLRVAAAAPPGSTEFLLVNLVQQAASDGYAWFNLGLAPAVGLEARALAPLLHVAARVLEHGEPSRPLPSWRRLSEKFDPVWSPRYLASPGGLALGLVLANVSRLLARSIEGADRRQASAG